MRCSEKTQICSGHEEQRGQGTLKFCIQLSTVYAVAVVSPGVLLVDSVPRCLLECNLFFTLCSKMPIQAFTYVYVCICIYDLYAFYIS